MMQRVRIRMSTLNWECYVVRAQAAPPLPVSRTKKY